MAALDDFVPRVRVAYLSMEIALCPQMHTYAGGLGVLAGDTARSCADLALPVVFVTLISREGYLRQEIDPTGAQIDHPDPWQPRDRAEPLDAMVAVRIEGRSVWIRPWLYVQASDHGTGHVPVLLLDTDLEQNAQEDRAITHRLYGGDAEYRLKQEIVLGVGGERVLHALEFEIETYHLNEGHAALLPVALLKRHPHPEDRIGPDGFGYDVDPVRAACVFTTHTPVEAGHDNYDYALVARLLDDFMPIEQLKRLGGADRLNMTRLALELSSFVNGVAERHAETTRRMFPQFRIREITNGVHAPSWVHPSLARLFDSVAPGWRHDPEELANADQLTDAELVAAHQVAKADLLAEVERRTGTRLSAELPTLVFARRMTGYKRPDLLFRDLERLRGIARAHPFQVVMAGKAHPADEGGKAAIRVLHDHASALAGELAVVFLPNYEIELARILAAGADVWLNTPLPPLEASGTSGMKAAMNGALNLSVLDGWWLEGWIEGDTGWAVGAPGSDPERHAVDLYDKLEGVVLPLYRDDPGDWARMMKQAISKIGSRFNSQRMMRRYASEAYLR